MSKKKDRTFYQCSSCEHKETRWLGRCPNCSEWNTMIEEISHKKSSLSHTNDLYVTSLNNIKSENKIRISTGIQELDRVLGGGLVKGSLILIGGDPGIGKSTLILQSMGCMATEKNKILYVSGEESIEQIKLRADRLCIKTNFLYLLADTHFESILKAQKKINASVCVIDSIQTMKTDLCEGGAGSITQIRTLTQLLMEMTKNKGISTFVIGHVTKDGAIAGPKIMEHMVDTVLYFEGDKNGPYRILRAHKNRFGSAQEISVFEMFQEGLKALSNPSDLFLSQRASSYPGSAVITSVEGSRPILLEVQALVTTALYGNPRRTTIGIENQRIAMLCAVISTKSSLDINGSDVYVNIAGGVKITEPAADLGIVVALISASYNKSLPENFVFIGEVGLSGEIRGVSYLDLRIQEAHSLGFTHAIIPQIDIERYKKKEYPIHVRGISNLKELFETLSFQS